MTDQPGHEPEQRLPARRDRRRGRAGRALLRAPVGARTRPDARARRRRSSASPRAHAGWASSPSVSSRLFVIAYYFYELGLPLDLSQPRLAVEADAAAGHRGRAWLQPLRGQLRSLPRTNGKGAAEGNYIAPPLNDPMKLFAHLNAVYLKNVLTVGGRYVCGSADSIMPVWADTNGGPLNYRAIEDLIAFIRSDATQEYIVRDPSLNEPVIGTDGKIKTFKGWLDPAFKPDPAASAVPACWSGSTATQGPTESLPPGSEILKVAAEGVAFDVKELTVGADKVFGIDFNQKDPAAFGGHNVEIRDASGKTIFDGAVIKDPAEVTYTVPALPAGTYTFICRIHPIPAMTGTLTVK